MATIKKTGEYVGGIASPGQDNLRLDRVAGKEGFRDLCQSGFQGEQSQPFAFGEIGCRRHSFLREVIE